MSTAGSRPLLAALGLMLVAADAPAQFLLPAPVGVVASGTGIVYTRSGRHSSLALAFGSPSLYGGGFYTTPFGYTGINQVTVIYAPPTVIQAPPPPVLAMAPRVLRLDDLPMLDPSLRSDPIPDRERMPPPPAPDLPGGRDAGVFRPLDPDNRNRAARPAKPVEPLPRPMPPPEPAPPAGELPRPPLPAADPKAESTRQMALGRTAFSAREYGRAAQRFRDAVKLTPAEPLPYFLLGQSLFAGGRYLEAAAAIRSGVQLRPDWPGVRFPPRELYGPNAADFEDHLRRLRAALEELRADPDLLFLLGYELWFDGKQDEARPFLLKARPGAADPAAIDRFLAAKPPV
jgi:hypothetical protein